MVDRDQKEGWDGIGWIARVDYGGEWVWKGRRGGWKVIRLYRLNLELWGEKRSSAFMR